MPQRLGEASSIRLKVRRVDSASDAPCSPGTLAIEARVVGGTHSSTAEIAQSSASETIKEGSQTLLASPLQDAVLTLIDPGNTALLTISAKPPSPPICHREVYAWVDDVVLE